MSIVKAIPQPDGSHHVVFTGMSVSSIDKDYPNWIVREATSRRGKTGKWYTRAVIINPAVPQRTVPTITPVVNVDSPKLTPSVPLQASLFEDCLVCKKCEGDGNYYNARMKQVIAGGCSNCDGLGHMTKARAKRNADNARDGIRTLPWCR
jgi:hypothetical protein